MAPKRSPLPAIVVAVCMCACGDGGHDQSEQAAFTPTPTPSPTATVTLGPGQCRTWSDCDSRFNLCLEPGGFAGCGICLNDDMIDSMYRRCHADSDCESFESPTVCQPLGQTSHTCSPCSGSPVLVCLTGCSTDEDCGAGRVCEGSRCIGARCRSDEDCLPEDACVSEEGMARCVRRACTNDFDCAGYCVNGLCYSEPGECVLMPS